MPAMRAVASTSPLRSALARINAGAVDPGEKCTVQTARAVRAVGGLCAMGTMWAVPVGVRWVSLGGDGDGGEDGEEGALDSSSLFSWDRRRLLVVKRRRLRWARACSRCKGTVFAVDTLAWWELAGEDQPGVWTVGLINRVDVTFF